MPLAPRAFLTSPHGASPYSKRSGARGDSTRDHFRDDAGYWPMSACLRVSASAAAQVWGQTSDQTQESDSASQQTRPVNIIPGKWPRRSESAQKAQAAVRPWRLVRHVVISNYILNAEYQLQQNVSDCNERTRKYKT